ncbi:MAG: universal stress protein [Bryobacterales bacterium]|nr:universal stress protein [Bryobacterales bacterium]
MKTSNPVLTIRRILVALDTSPSSQAALEAAVALAQRVKAEVFGLFVEDVDLLRVAESPYAREVLYPSAREGRLTRGVLENRLRIQAEQARRALLAAARRANVPCTFLCVRGKVSSELLAAAAKTDLIAIGRLGWSMGARLRIGSTAMDLVASSGPVLLLSEYRVPGPLHFVLYFDGSADARKALRWAAEVAASDSGRLSVLLAAENEEQADQLREDAGNLLTETGLKAGYRPMDPTDRAGLLSFLKQVENGMFVLGTKEPFKKLPMLEAVLRESKVAVLLFRYDGEQR